MRDAFGMDTAMAAGSKSRAADTRGRRWSAEEREVIVQASLKRDTTVKAVARLYGVKSWQIYEWRKQVRQAAQRIKAASLLPVEVTESVERGDIGTESTSS